MADAQKVEIGFEGGQVISVRLGEDELTIEDPVAFTQPWKVTIPYERVTDLDRMVHGLCDENDRNPVVDGKIIIAPAGR